MNLKYLIPIPVKQALEELLTPRMGEFILTSQGEGKFIIREKNSDSPFYFSYTPIDQKSAEIERYPSNQDLALLKSKIERDRFKRILAVWLEIVESVKSPSPLFDQDPILNSYIQEQEAYFEIVDEDATYAPFSHKRQVALHNVYDVLINEMLNDAEQSPELEAYVKELKESQKEIGTQTKKEAVGRLSKNIAKARKFGIEVFQKVLVKLTAQGVIDFWPMLKSFGQHLLE